MPSFLTQLKEQNIKHARWLRGSAARPLMRWLSWMELNITWKQLGGKKTMGIQWMWPWVDNDDHAAERIYLHLQHGFCLVGQKRKKERNAKRRLFVYFHIFCVRGRNSTSLKHFIDYLTNYWNCKIFSLLLVKGCFGWTSATLIINSVTIYLVASLGENSAEDCFLWHHKAEPIRFQGHCTWSLC